MNIIMHVNYLERAMPLDKVVARCADAGYDGIELRDRDRSGRIPLDEYLQWTTELAQRHSLMLVYGSRNNTTENADVDVEFERLQQVIRQAATAGSPLVNMFTGLLIPPDVEPRRFELTGSSCATQRNWQASVDYLKQAATLAEQHDIDLCLETHNGYLHDLAKPAAKLVDLVNSPRVKINLDLGNIGLNANAESLTDEIETAGSRIGYAHLKNYTQVRFTSSPGYFMTPLSMGDLNHYILLPQILKHLQGNWLAIENTMPGDKREIMHMDLNYLHKLLDEIDNSSQSHIVNKTLTPTSK